MPNRKVNYKNRLFDEWDERYKEFKESFHLDLPEISEFDNGVPWFIWSEHPEWATEWYQERIKLKYEEYMKQRN